AWSESISVAFASFHLQVELSSKGLASSLPILSFLDSDQQRLSTGRVPPQWLFSATMAFKLFRRFQVAGVRSLPFHLLPRPIESGLKRRHTRHFLPRELPLTA